MTVTVKLNKSRMVKNIKIELLSEVRRLNEKHRFIQLTSTH